jgi:hypothetical protein
MAHTQENRGAAARNCISKPKSSDKSSSIVKSALSYPSDGRSATRHQRNIRHASAEYQRAILFFVVSSHLYKPKRD